MKRKKPDFTSFMFRCFLINQVIEGGQVIINYRMQDGGPRGY